MFDIGFDEMLMIAIVAIVVIGPKDLPMALRTAGRWVAKVRRVSGHFRAGVETMIREAELEEMERKWREQNEAIMRETDLTAAAAPAVEPASAEAALLPPPVSPAPPAPPVSPDSPAPRVSPDLPVTATGPNASTWAEPELPLSPP